MTFKQRYTDRTDQIAPAATLVANTAASAKRAKPQHSAWMRAVAMVAVVALCLFTATSVLSATVPLFDNILYLISPATAQFFKPVQRSCENNGVRMEVKSIYIHEDKPTAEILVSLTDLEGGLMDGKVDLYDSYSIRRPFDSTGHCSFADYDPATRTATFLIQISEWGDHRIEGGKMTLLVREFMSGQQVIEDQPLAIDLSTTPTAPETITREWTGASGANHEIVSETVQFLKTGEPLLFLTDYSAITAMGFVDGKLRVQVSNYDNSHTDSHGWLSMVNANGAEIPCENAFSYGVTEADGSKTHIYDYIFDITPDEIEGCTLYGDFYAYASRTEGPWEITFPLENTD